MKLSNTKLLDLSCQQQEYTNTSLMPSREKVPKPLKVQMHRTRSGDLISYYYLFEPCLKEETPKKS